MRPASLLKFHLISQCPDLVHLDFHHVAVFQKCLWLHEYSNTSGCARHDRRASRNGGAYFGCMSYLA